MKKLLGLFVILSCVLIISGCGKENKLVCTKDDDEIRLYFDGDKVTKYTTVETYDSEQTAKLYEAVYNTEKDLKFSFKRDGKKIELTYKIEDTENKEEFAGTKKEIKDNMSKANWSCK